MRLLPERHDDCRRGIACQESQPDGSEYQGRLHQHAAFTASLPLRHLLRNHRRRTARRQGHECLMRRNTMTPTTTLTRRGFVNIGGALFVSLAMPAARPARAADSQTSLDPTLLPSWLEIR